MDSFPETCNADHLTDDQVRTILTLTDIARAQLTNVLDRRPFPNDDDTLRLVEQLRKATDLMVDLSSFRTTHKEGSA